MNDGLLIFFKLLAYLVGGLGGVMVVVWVLLKVLMVHLMTSINGSLNVKPRFLRFISRMKKWSSKSLKEIEQEVMRP